jgi:hypothetical protein
VTDSAAAAAAVVAAGGAACPVTNTGANARGQTLTSGLLGPVFLRPERLVDVAMARR